MNRLSRSGWCVVTGALAISVLALPACDSSSPTAPEKSQNVMVSVRTTVPPAGPPGTTTIVTSVCDCTAADVGVFIDGAASAKLKCADTWAVHLAAGQHTLAFEWPDQRPAVSLTVETTDTSNETIEVRCEYR